MAVWALHFFPPGVGQYSVLLMRKIKRLEIQPESTAERGIEMCAMGYSV